MFPRLIFGRGRDTTVAVHFNETSRLVFLIRAPAPLLLIGFPTSMQTTVISASDFVLAGAPPTRVMATSDAAMRIDNRRSGSRF